jgi:hypothetical protein
LVTLILFFIGGGSLVGCASNTGVVPSGQGNYMIAKQAATGFPGLGNLKAEALEEGNRYCLQQGQGRELSVLRTNETQPPYVLGNYPRSKSNFVAVRLV